MKSLDGRKLDHKTLQEMRVRAVSQVQAGQSPEHVIKVFGFSRACIYDWLSKYRAGGWDALKARKLTGRPWKINGKQMKWIYDTVTMKNPLQLKLPYALWTREMIRQLIERKYGIKLSLASVGRLLAQLGLSCQKPLVKAFQQNPSLVEKWLKEEYPAIKALAKRQKAAIYFGDEAGVRSDFHSGITWAPIGKTPIVRATSARFGLNMISAISPKGHMKFMIIGGKLSAMQFCDFLRRLIYRAANPIFFIVDGHPVHRATAIKRFLAKEKKRLKLFFLPPYSPELNPDELVWNDLKNNGIGRMTVSGPQDLKQKSISHMRTLQRDTQKIQSFFQSPTTKYAALNV